MPEPVPLLVVGGGKMGEALVAGLLSSGREPGGVWVVEPIAARREELTATHGIAALEEPVACDGCILAVKPQHVDGAARAVAAAGVRRVLSIAAGVPIAAIEAALGTDAAVVRAMPNTPAQVGEGAAAIAAGTHATQDDIDWAAAILGAVGEVVVVGEPLLDAVTGLSGSGPAYVFLVAEALVEAGVLNGLPRDTAHRLAVQTLAGSARLLQQPGADPARLRADVTSPGGTTAAGLRALEAGGVRSAFLEAVTAATRRSVELGT
jgi:pyrroline-5-carboxylate reductase